MTFDRVAPFYDRLAHLVFGRSLERAQVALLDQLPTGGNWLLLGGGTGWLLEQVMNRCGPESVLYVEASEKMITLAHQRLRNHPQIERVIFRHGTEASLTPNESFDVILTPFVLDLFPDDWLAGRLIPSLVRALTPNGYWLATDFVPTNVWWQRGLTKAMFLFFRLTAGLTTNRLPDWTNLLARKLTPEAEQFALNGFVASVLFRKAA